MPVWQRRGTGVLGAPQLWVSKVRLYSVLCWRLDTVWPQQVLVEVMISLSTLIWKPECLPLGSVQDRMTFAFVVFGPSHFRFVTGLASAASNRNDWIMTSFHNFHTCSVERQAYLKICDRNKFMWNLSRRYDHTCAVGNPSWGTFGSIRGLCGDTNVIAFSRDQVVDISLIFL